MMYTQKLMDHFMNPRNVGIIENPDGYAKVGSPSCGDMMEIFLMIKENVITDAKFRTFGCASAIASSSVTTEMVIGKTIKEALELTNKSIAENLDGLPASKLHCSVLAEEVINEAIEDYRFRK
ncbi:MAG: Fe-S cluster assembly scaffold protein NifU [Psychrilyobacter sp.]|uniref:Fe-S cluster assembly scaffold protein NifU n=1 Tax=Psychrilyobacter sp. TaxID=2586924 RepID=UPI003C74D590